MLKQAKQPKSTPWLCLLTSSFTPPNGHLLRTIIGHTNSVNSIAVTADSKLVISGSDDNTVRIWNLETGEEVLILTGHTKAVTSVAVTWNESRVISASSDHTLKVWDLSSWELIASFTGESALRCCAVAPDGVTIVAGEASGRVHFLRLEGV